MKITMYELLGLVKDGKAPKKIVYNGTETEYDKDTKDYYPYYDKYLFEYEFSTCKNFLNDEVKIIEEPKEGKIQKICHCETGLIQNEVEIFIIKQLNQMVDKINELIDEINTLKEK